MPVQLLLTPRRGALLLGHDNRLDVLVRAIAPASPPEVQRQPLNLALVLDRSGSMAGRPLAEAKACAASMVDRLGPQDRVSVVAYDSTVDVVVANAPCTDRDRIKTAISSIGERGCTALHDGWAAGAEQAALAAAHPGVSRVLLLSDGCANVGLTDPAAIARHCEKMAEAGVSTSTYGLAQHFNEELMALMARAGRGNAYYGETAADLMDPFEREFDLLQALHSRNLRLELVPAEGVGAQVVNDYPQVAGGWRLPDIAFGSEAWALVKLKVPRGLAAQSGDHPVRILAARLTCTDMEGRDAFVSETLHLAALPVATYEAVAEDDLVASRARELQVAVLQLQARAAAQIGDWEGVDAVLLQARTEAADHPWLAEALPVLEKYASQRDTGRFAKEAYYGFSAMSSRITATDEGVGYDAASESSKASFLRRKREAGRDERRPRDPVREPKGSSPA